MGAAADYNRALAYAPHDPALLRIVSSLHGAEARRRFLRRAVPLGLGTVLLGALAFGVTREFRSRHSDSQSQPIASSPRVGAPSSVQAARVDPSNSAVLVTTAVTHAAIDAASPALPTTTQAAKPAPAAAQVKPGVREIKFNKVFPKNIVAVFVDGERVLEKLSVESTLSFPMDDKPHELKFACAPDYCEPKVQPYEPGQGPPPSQSVTLKFRDAKLYVAGNSGSSYAIDDPAQQLNNGLNMVPMGSNSRLTVTVREYGSKNPPQTITLVAGQRQEVNFVESTAQ
jgi:hypothetical protein